MDKRDVMFHKMEDGTLRAICLYNGLQFEKCSCNQDSLCMTRLFDYPRMFYHDFDGKNVWKCPCG
jgi:hypothetical protein